MARKPAQVTLAKPGARIRVCFTVIMVMAGTHHALPSIAVSNNIGAFVLGKACVKCAGYMRCSVIIIQSTTPVLPVC